MSLLTGNFWAYHYRCQRGYRKRHDIGGRWVIEELLMHRGTLGGGYQQKFYFLYGCREGVHADDFGEGQFDVTLQVGQSGLPLFLLIQQKNLWAAFFHFSIPWELCFWALFYLWDTRYAHAACF